MNKTVKFGTIFSIIGLTIIVAVILSRSVYPDPIFRIFAPVGLFFVFVGLVLFIVSWIKAIKKEQQSGNYVGALLIAVGGILFAMVNFFK